MSQLINNILDLFKLGQTKRWHTQVMLKDQDVAQHVYNMMWLVYVLTAGHASETLWLATLQHDGGEQATGDMPGHIKRTVPGLDVTLDKLEVEHLANLGVRNVLPLLGVREAYVLKLADRFEGWLYALREVRMGNRDMVCCAIRYKAFVAEMIKYSTHATDTTLFSTVSLIHESTIEICQ